MVASVDLRLSRLQYYGLGLVMAGILGAVSGRLSWQIVKGGNCSAKRVALDALRSPRDPCRHVCCSNGALLPRLAWPGGCVPCFRQCAGVALSLFP